MAYETVRCPWCRVAPGQPCVRVKYRCRRGEDRPLASRPRAQRPHRSRVRRANNAAKEGRLS